MLEIINKLIYVVLLMILVIPLVAIFTMKKHSEKYNIKTDLYLSVIYIFLFILATATNSGTYYLRPLLLVSSILFFYNYKKAKKKGL